MAWGTTLNIIFRLQTKEDGGWVGRAGQLWEVTRKGTLNKGKVVMQIYLLAFSMIRLFRDLDNLLFWYREGDTLINESLSYKCKCLYKRVTSKIFSQLLCLLFLKNNHIKIIVMPMCGGTFCSPSEPVEKFHYSLLFSIAHFCDIGYEHYKNF